MLPARPQALSRGQAAIRVPFDRTRLQESGLAPPFLGSSLVARQPPGASAIRLTARNNQPAPPAVFGPTPRGHQTGRVLGYDRPPDPIF